jgi:2-dehydro-3-deoxyphosphogluconate aldolase/(4S)-4-hydroxy-2-oxoglutarate aldolase
MARFDRLTVFNTILADGLVPLFYHADSGVALRVAGALSGGGSHVLEFTNRGDFAVEVFAALVKECARAHPDLIIGVGTVDDAATAALFIAHGANFVVGPTFNVEVARLCNRRKIAYLPGCGTVSEIAQAEEWGAEIVKLFPAETLGGPDFVRGVLGPRPWSRMMPTGGVTPDHDSLKSWFSAGVVAVGMGSKLIRSDWVKAGNYDGIADLTKTALGLIRAVR